LFIIILSTAQLQKAVASEPAGRWRDAPLMHCAISLARASEAVTRASAVHCAIASRCGMLWVVILSAAQLQRVFSSTPSGRWPTVPLTQASYAMPNRSGSLLVLVVTYGPVDGPAAPFEACSAMTVDAPTLP